jgi:hypothetical protein
LLAYAEERENIVAIAQRKFVSVCRRTWKYCCNCTGSRL